MNIKFIECNENELIQESEVLISFKCANCRSIRYFEDDDWKKTCGCGRTVELLIVEEKPTVFPGRYALKPLKITSVHGKKIKAKVRKFDRNRKLLELKPISFNGMKISIVFEKEE